METTAQQSKEWCPYCSHPNSNVYHLGKCPYIKAIEYYENGTVKRVEFNS